MKKLFIVTLLVTWGILGKAQQWGTNGTNIYNTNNGFVGIGISSTATPLFKLSIVGSGVAANTAIGINATQVLYLPEQVTSFAGSLAIGTGLRGLSYTSGTQGQNNTAVGINCLSVVSGLTGAFNVGLGTAVLISNTSGSNNIGIGHGALLSNIGGNENTAIGRNGLYNNQGSFNVAMGVNALVNNTSGNSNTVVGHSAAAGTAATTGNNNTILGYSAASNIAGTAAGNIAIGSGANLPVAGNSNQLNIGNLIFGTGLSTSGTAVLGKIGIGIINPANTLEIYSAANGTSGLRFNRLKMGNANTFPTGNGQALTVDGNGDVVLVPSIAVAADGSETKINNTGQYIAVSGSGTSGSPFSINVNGPWVPESPGSVNIKNNNITGAVFIGSTNNFTQGLSVYPYKLLVSGGILTEKIKAAVQSGANWSDYVFAKDYCLKSLEEVETYINTNKHLPGVPSAEELVKDGGIDMNEMFAKQMEKIEELTLYIIEQNKKIEALEKKVNLKK